MAEPKINEQNVHKPIQLLAAWLSGLIITNGSFLGAATQISQPEWAAGILTIAAVVNVPIFLICIFLLQTKFRPEMQEDRYYAKYLEKRWSVATGSSEIIELKIEPKREKLESIVRSQEHNIFKSDELLYEDDEDARHCIRVNSLLKSAKFITQSIESRGFEVGQSFGHDSNDPVEPTTLVVSFTKHSNSILVHAAVQASLEFDLEGIGIVQDMLSSKAVYIGSYIYKFGIRVKSIDNDLVEIAKKPHAHLDEYIEWLAR